MNWDVAQVTTKSYTVDDFADSSPMGPKARRAEQLRARLIEKTESDMARKVTPYHFTLTHKLNTLADEFRIFSDTLMKAQIMVKWDDSTFKFTNTT